MKKQLLSSLACMLITLFTHATSTIIEAENCILTGTASAVSDGQRSGGKYVDIKSGGFEYTFTQATESYFDIYLYVASPNGEKYNNFVIDGNSATFGFSEASPYTKLKVGAFVKLDAGQHTLAVESSWGYVHIDYIEMVEVDLANRFDIVENLVTPNPSKEATALYDFIKDNYGQKIISGVMTLNSMDMTDWLLTNTGKEPVIIGLDFMQANVGYSWYDDNEPRNDGETWWNKGGIPVYCWHWRDPSDVTNEFYTKHLLNHPDGTEFDSRTIFDVGSANYNKMIADIDFVAEEFKYLQNKNIPVIWRPLHEASGGWFWWGANGAEACVEIWKVMFDRMTNYHGLNNIIWVWTHQAGESPDWYPGDEYVDLVGQDIYKDGDHSSQIMEFNNTNSVYTGNKIVSESECGSFPDPDNLIADKAAWSWFMPWYGKYVNDGVYNSKALWQKTMDHDYVITLDEMPDLTTYTSASDDNAELKSLTLSEGKLHTDFTPATLTYTVQLPDETPVPTVTAVAKNANATVFITPASAIPGTTTVSVESVDKTVTTTYEVAYSYYTPEPTSIAITPATIEILVGETATFEVVVLDQNDNIIVDTPNWSLSDGGTLSTLSGATTTFTPDGTEGIFTLAVSHGTLYTSATITVIDGHSDPIPTASEWTAFNTWNNQDNGSGVSDGTGALQVDHIQWGYGELWLVNSGVEIDVEQDVEYEVSFDFQDQSTASIASVDFGFADTWSGAGVTSEQSTKGTTTSITADAFGTVSQTVTSSKTGKTHLYFRLSWGTDPANDKPTVAYTALLKNITVKPVSNTPTQTIVLEDGWNLVSTYITAQSSDVLDVFTCADKLKDQTEFFSIDQEWYLNSITTIEANHGYLVKTPSGCTVTISGEVATLTSITLKEGWNLVGFPFTQPVDLELSLAPILSKVEAIKDFDSFWKANLDGGLDTLEPGKAYFVKVTEDLTFTVGNTN